MFSEIRCGTLVNQFTELKRGMANINKFISWNVDDISVNKNIPYFYQKLTDPIPVTVISGVIVAVVSGVYLSVLSDSA